MRTVHSLLTAAAVCAAAFAVAGPAAALTDYQKNQILQYLDHEAMRRDPAIFDGTKFVAGVEFPVIAKYYDAYVEKLNRATAEWNKLSKADAASPDGRAIAAKLKAALDWGKAMQVHYPALAKAYKEKVAAAGAAAAAKTSMDKESKAAHQAKCKAFADASVHHTPFREPMWRMIDIMFGSSLDLATVESVKKHREVLEAVAKVCAGGYDEAFFSRPCWFNESGPEQEKRNKSPKNWCDAAAKKDELIKKGAGNYLAKTSQLAARWALTPEQLQQKEGWLPIEDWTTYAGATTLSEAEVQKTVAGLKPVLDAAGIAGGKDLSFFDEERARKAAIKAKVDELAPTWTLPTNDGSDYSTALAVKQAKKAHGNAKGVKAWLSRSTWNISKNALDVPQQRTKPGYILFQLPGEPWCQLRQYTLTEDYKGGGTFQQASGVKIGYVRFQKCQ